MSINNSQNGDLAPELKATMTGSKVQIGTLLHNPVMIIFDNLGTDTVEISKDIDPTWKTFAPGSALVLDLRCQQGKAPNFTFRTGMTFFGNGASGDFSISYVYAKETP